ncbi:Formyl transferase [Kaistella treverensis]|uniref:phosphoribosylglycinamide formyltransferase 1 n=1 Tax=Kaistella treverensis TaxID=631455 RepID=A0A1I3NJP9_9FLAO|nr:formyl transferase [Kaistella treverensis]SFJ09392.1 Formyl transferase [Kaistella treverensis]
MKIVVLCGQGDSSRYFYHAMAGDFEISKVIMEEPVPKSVLIRNRIKRLGLLTVIDQLLFQTIVTRVLKFVYAGRLRELKKVYRLNDALIPENVLISVPSVNDAATLSILRELQPDIVIVNGTRIISRKVLRILKNAKVVNTHLGITPEYRGVHGAYWALANADEEHCGVTVHEVDSGIDTGKIYRQKKIEVDRNKDSFITYPLHQYFIGIGLLKEVIADLNSGKSETFSKVSPDSKLYYHPGFTYYIKNFLKGRK